MSESTANNIFHYWQSLFREVLPYSLIEQVKKSGEDEEVVREALREYELIVDNSEQARERPVDYSVSQLNKVQLVSVVFLNFYESLFS